MQETLHIFSGTPKNAKWEESAEGLSNARERMKQLAGTNPGQYFIVALGSDSILAQTETFSQVRRVPESNDQVSAAEHSSPNYVVNRRHIRTKVKKLGRDAFVREFSLEDIVLRRAQAHTATLLGG